MHAAAGGQPGSEVTHRPAHAACLACVEMDTSTAALVFIVGVVAMLSGSDMLVKGLDRLGGNLMLGGAVLGLLTAFGADSPEISSAVTATASGASAVGVGVVIGSNLFNLAALLAVPALAAGTVRARPHRMAVTGGVSAVMTLIVAAILFTPIPPVAGTALLLAVFGLLVAVLVAPERLADVPFMPKRARRLLKRELRRTERELKPDTPRIEGSWRDRTSWKPALFVPPALAAIVAGSIVTVHAALLLAGRYDIPRSVLGTLILALVTGIPNAYAAINLARAGKGPAVVSEAFNSNSINLLAGIGLPVLLVGLHGAAGTLLWWLLGVTVLAVALLWEGRGIGRRGAIAVLTAYLAFVVVDVWF
jgi:cation:H+ antiporter